MRLIDANKVLLNNTEILIANGSFKDALEIQLGKIENAPTIEAIPVEWLEKEAEDWEYHNELVAAVLKSIIKGRCWEERK